MFAVLEQGTLAYEGLWQQLTRQGLAQLTYQVIGDIRYGVIKIPFAKKLDKHWAKAEALLQSQGIRTILPTFPFSLCEGTPPSNPMVALAPRVVADVAKRLHVTRGGLSVGVMASRVSQVIEQVIGSVLPYARELLLVAGSDAEPFAYRLRRDFGIAAQVNPTEGRFQAVDVQLQFAEDTIPLPAQTVVLQFAQITSHTSYACVIDEVRLQPVKFVHEGIDPTVWTHTLFDQGLLSPQEIQVAQYCYQGHVVHIQ